MQTKQNKQTNKSFRVYRRREGAVENDLLLWVSNIIYDREGCEGNGSDEKREKVMK